MDRATLRQARADNLQYADDPQYLTYFSLFFANGSDIHSPRINTFVLARRLADSHDETRKESVFQTTYYRDFFCTFYPKDLYCETDSRSLSPLHAVM